MKLERTLGLGPENPSFEFASKKKSPNCGEDQKPCLWVFLSILPLRIRLCRFENRHFFSIKGRCPKNVWE
ncbi:MAG: hypothetical protein ACLFRG_05840 [Desulfococcaceae bacterium]